MPTAAIPAAISAAALTATPLPTAAPPPHDASDAGSGSGVAVKAAALIAAGIAAVGTTHQAAKAVTAPPTLERSQLVAVTSASTAIPIPRATRTLRPARPKEAPVRPARATKHRAARITPAVGLPSVTGVEPAPGAAQVAPAAQSRPEPRPVELPALPAVAVEVEVEAPSVPPLPVELPQVVVPVTLP